MTKAEVAMIKAQKKYTSAYEAADKSHTKEIERIRKVFEKARVVWVRAQNRNETWSDRSCPTCRIVTAAPPQQEMI